MSRLLRFVIVCLAVGAALFTLGCDGSQRAGAADQQTAVSADREAERAAADTSTTDAETAERRFVLTYRAVVNDVPQDAGTVRVWIPYPRSDENQDVEVLEVSGPVESEIREGEEHGNRMLFFEIGDPAAKSLEFEMQAEVRRDEVLRRDLPGLDGPKGNASGEYPPEIATWLEPDRLVPLDERIRELSAEVTAGLETDAEKARAIYDYVVETMTYDKTGTGWGRGDIYWACDVRSGNCTDFHALFTGLCRAAGIPAKFAIGFPIPADRGEGQVGGYHCWSDFYLRGYGWVPVDASEASKAPEKTDYYFGGHDENRVEFTEGRDLVLSPEQEGEPLNFFVYPYVEVDGAPWDAVSYEFFYRDVEDSKDGSGEA